MTSKELRDKFLKFFESKGHRIVSSSSLLPADPTVLFTTAGMQQFKRYFLGEKSPYGNKVASCQKCFRTSDIEEVGDNTHLTFLEMLGNFSFGDYFKKEAIEWALEFLTKVCGLEKEKLWVTVFEGDKEVPEDKESREIWKSLGFAKEKIHGFSRKDNFWGPTGLEGPCGPTTEIHCELSSQPCSLAKKCLPNCNCGRFVELWNLVFNEYYQNKNKELISLKQKGVDTGMGLERLAAVVQQKPSVYETDLFPAIGQSRAEKIIIDHIKGAVFLASEGILPSNMEQGYVLRRLLRRAIRYGKILGTPKDFLISLAQKNIEIYQDFYPQLRAKQADILTVIQNEEEKFSKTLEKGLNQFEKLAKDGKISGKEVFNLYQSYGFPLELTEELAKEKNIKINKRGFGEALKKHQEISRLGAEKKFKGGLADQSEQVTKYHTATHLLLASLRQILGEHIYQKGSNITAERLRFDFSHPQKLSPEELKKVEDLVNQKIKEDLEVKWEEMALTEAQKQGAMGVFGEKYGERVKVYTIFNPKTGEVFSKEICGGPHVKRTSELGNFIIIKEESPGAGIRRLRAILE